MDRRSETAHRQLMRAPATLLLAAALFTSHAALAQNASEGPKGAPQTKELDAEGMTIYGQRELPKVLYIVPWKKMKSSDIEMPVTESLVSDVLDPIDPEVFRRQIKYYDAMHGDEKSK